MTCTVQFVAIGSLVLNNLHPADRLWNHFMTGECTDSLGSRLFQISETVLRDWSGAEFHALSECLNYSEWAGERIELWGWRKEERSACFVSLLLFIFGIRRVRRARANSNIPRRNSSVCTHFPPHHLPSVLINFLTGRERNLTNAIVGTGKYNALLPRSSRRLPWFLAIINFHWNSLESRGQRNACSPSP